ncbi:Guanosine-diphosphatase [Xylographa carneopallida]|nr:Guanosine-diphosphatase [Xylographa carneopallida]
MSTGVDARRRPSIWSYISFTSSPRRRSVTLPTRNGHHDPFEKTKRHTSNGLANGPAGAVESLKAVWMTQSQRARYLRAGGIIAVFVFLFFLLSPNGRANVGDFVGNSGSGSLSSDPSVGTTKCSKSYSSDKPLTQYALMIDAGSTGSRIHVYRFNNCGATPELEHEEFKMTEPKKGGSGLSSFGADAEGAARSLDVLMDVAMQTVPDKLKSCSPVAVKATAGLRKLGPELSDKILEAVRTRLETVYPFPVVSKEKDGVVVMEGKDEGVYAWITTNYLLGKIGGPDKSPTAAVFDLGGGSTQIVFQPTFKSPTKGMPDKLAEGDHKYKLNFGGRDFELYQHSHLGYGLMSARETMHKTLVQSVSDSYGSDKSWMTKTIEHPCIAPNMSTEVKVTLDDGTEASVTMVGPWTGAPAQCRGLAERILKKEEKCELAPCSFGGVHQPSLEMTFAREDVYIFSYFYDRTQPLGMPESFTLKELRDLTEKVCQGEKCWETFQGVDGAIKELRDRPEYCLDLNFMMALLHTGYEMPIDREVRIAKKIKGNELGWCLGARYVILRIYTIYYVRLKKA